MRQEADFEIGTFVVVTEGRRWVDSTGARRVDRSYVGELLEVRGVQFPFVVFTNHSCGSSHPCRRITLDVSEYTVEPATPSFKKATMEQRR